MILYWRNYTDTATGEPWRCEAKGAKFELTNIQTIFLWQNRSTVARSVCRTWKSDPTIVSSRIDRAAQRCPVVRKVQARLEDLVTCVQVLETVIFLLNPIHLTQPQWNDWQHETFYPSPSLRNPGIGKSSAILAVANTLCRPNHQGEALTAPWSTPPLSGKTTKASM